MYDLGIAKSFSRPRVSNDNPYSEALFKTLKYIPEYPAQGFKTIEAARQWTETFVQWYNESHLHKGIRYVTPSQKHLGEDVSLLQKRHQVYTEAKQRNPRRWSGKTRNWSPIKKVVLNPRNHSASQKKEMLIA